MPSAQTQVELAGGLYTCPGGQTQAEVLGIRSPWHWVHVSGPEFVHVSQNGIGLLHRVHVAPER